MMNLKIEYISQQNNAIRNDCGPACAAMLVNAYTEQVVTIEDYYADLDITPGSYQAITDMKRFMAGFGVGSIWLANNSRQSLETWINERKPFIALINYAPLAPVTFYKGVFSHFVVVVGYDENHVYIHDPYWPPDNPGGADLQVPSGLFADAWNTLQNNPQGGALVPTEPLGDIVEEDVIGLYKVTAGFLNVRSGPGTTYPTIGGLKRDDIIEATMIEGNWVRFARGWASKSYLEAMEQYTPGTVTITYKVDAPPGVDVKIVPEIE